MKIVVALGGNSILKKGEKQTYSTLIKNIKSTCRNLIPIIRDNKVVITHGNGPEIGYLAIQNEIASSKVPKMPLDILGAESQALIGYLLEEQLNNQLREHKIKRPVATLVTQVLVNKKDGAFKNPTKPIGPFYTKKEGEKLKKKGYKIIEDAGRGYRRIVASPKPVKIIEKDIIKKLVENNVVVIACGGGGIPVVTEEGKLKGIEGVIDKDLASSCLGKSINADVLLILTGVPYVYLNYGKKNQKIIKKMNIKEAKKYLNEDHFGVGSMKPKIEAGIDFLLYGGKRVIITEPRFCTDALMGKKGTLIIR